MSKRKKSTPVRLLNQGKNWTWDSFEKEYLKYDEFVEDDEIPAKSPKINITKKLSTTITCFTAQNKQYFLGKMYIGTTRNVFPNLWKKCKIVTANGDILKMSFDNETDAVVQLTEEVNFILDLLQTKVFSYDFDINTECEKVFILIYIQLPLKKFNVKIGEVIKKVMYTIFNMEIKALIEEKSIVKDINAEEFYKEISECRSTKEILEENDITVQHESLLPKLRPYQCVAVKWMIKREQIPEITETLHPLYKPVTLESGQIIYYNQYTGYIEINKLSVSSSQTGGILADEMGLGKTVEVLACILNNPRKDLDVKNDSVVNQEVDDKTESNEEIAVLDNSDHTYTKGNIDCPNNESSFKEEIEDSQIKPENNCELEQNTSQSESDKNNIRIDINMDEGIPKIETQNKYVKPKVKKTKENIKKRKLKTFEEEVQNKPKMSAARRAAQLWYENKLAEMQIKEKKKSNIETEVRCICGDFTRIGIVYCVDCKKMQHADCMGYKGDKDNYFCPQCWTEKPPIKSKGTLIVSPMSISRQWSLEIQNHVRKNGLKVLVYKGIHGAGVMYPTDLANYDLVITTYTVLQSEIKFSNEEQCTKSFRYAKRYSNPNTPLLHIQWWRLCLDEAQTVDCPTYQVSLMANQLNAVHRWAVTGTPIQKNISDIYGLISYLKISPYDDNNAWNYLLYYPYLTGNKQPMINFLSEVMWRSAKADVLEQIAIPPQTIEEHWYEFSAVEKYFYKREHMSCSQDLINKLNDFDSLDKTLKSVDKRVLSKILAPLLSLRQACIHPRAVRGRYLARYKSNSMEDLLEALIKKNALECEESIRAVLAALNGMAGLLLLKGNSLDAVETYRHALQFMAEYENHELIKIDKLQRIHSLYNLNEILHDNSYPAPPATLRDDKLADEYEQVEAQYLEKYISETRSALNDAEAATENVKKLKNKLTMDEGEWACELNDWLIINSIESELLRRIQNTMDYEHCKIKFEEIASMRSVMYLLTTWIDKLNKHYDKIQKLFTQFKNECNNTEDNYYISDKIVNAAMACHLRPAKNKKKNSTPCLCCLIDNNLKKYECIIFQMKVKVNYENESDMKSKGTWHPSFEERVFKVIHTFGKAKGADQDLLKDGETHLSLCEARRKEFKEIRRLYTFYDKQVSAQDEVNICKIRFRLRNPEEPVKIIEKKKTVLRNLDYDLESKYEFINVLNEFDLDYCYSQLYSEREMAEYKLTKVMGTHSYLETLKKQQYSGEDPDPCPICGNKLVDSWSIFQCGHCYCLECLDNLLERYRILRHVTCSVCRKRQLCDDIAYIKVKSTDKSDDVMIEGSYSTKLQAIIKSVLMLKQEDETVKILLFSTWNTVLQVLSEAFEQNNISFEHLTSQNLHEKLENFKDAKKGVTACLIPFSLGAKGLNIIEATHVFLLEPLMNPGEELQAIGRVHRIGQTKPTFVHRFFIKNTIEENIHNAISANAKQWDKNKLTLLQLKNLFVDTDISVLAD